MLHGAKRERHLNLSRSKHVFACTRLGDWYLFAVVDGARCLVGVVSRYERDDGQTVWCAYSAPLGETGEPDLEEVVDHCPDERAAVSELHLYRDVDPVRVSYESAR
jgi:hypothetical protein